MRMDCREFFGYLFYSWPVFEMNLLPAEAQDHLEICPKCRAKVAELKAAFELLRQKEKQTARLAKESLARILARVQERLKRGDLGDLPGVPEVSCRMVRPFLSLAADPLGGIFPSVWIEKHLANCEDCERDYRLVCKLRDSVIVSEILASNRDITIDDIFPEATPSVTQQILRLANIRPSDMTCEEVRPYYHSMATCDYERPIPGEIYIHTRYCKSCEKQVKQLRTKLSIAIPRVGSPEFAALLSSKG